MSPVVDSAEYALDYTDIVHIDMDGVQRAARFISRSIANEKFEPELWRQHPLHVVPTMPYDRNDSSTRACLDFIFLVSALNFGFWSEQDELARYAVQWQGVRWTGYHSLLAAIKRAMQAGIPILHAEFYASPEKCSDQLLESIFRPDENSVETIPLLSERISILREVGSMLCTSFGGSYQNVLHSFQPESTRALDVVRTILLHFPSFNDEVLVGGKKVFFWKRAQILVAETWAAFHPSDRSEHPYFPSGVSDLTMFADYRVPQLLHHLNVTVYPPPLQDLLRSLTPLAAGSPEEVSIRAASIVAVERIKDAIICNHADDARRVAINSVLIDFWLWEKAKKVDSGTDVITELRTSKLLPCHRTRSIWY